MPTYVYEPCSGGCTICEGTFEINRPIDREPLTHCPLCKKEVRKVFAGFNTPPNKARPLSIVDAKKAGFTVLKKIGKGEYEKQ